MPYVSMNDHRDAKGELNWTSYRAAQRENGEICYICGGHADFPKGHQARCRDCEKLERSDKIRHDRLIRCPWCSHHYNPNDSDNYEVFADGEHPVSCPSCGKDFAITTDVSYTFNSPPLSKSGNEEDDDE